MANITMNDASLAQMAAGDVAEDDIVSVWDVSAGQMKRATRRVAVGAKITGDKALVAPADGTLALLEVAQTFTALQIMAGIASGVTPTINDDTVFSFTPPAPMGVLLIWNRVSAANGGQRSALIAYRAVAANTYGSIIAQPSTTIEVSTAALTGTTGTDGKITVSAAADGKIYIENRSGSSIILGYMIFGAS